MKHPFKVGDIVMALRDASGCVEEGQMYKITCISLEESWGERGVLQPFIGFVCKYDDANGPVSQGKETNWMAKNFTLVERDGRKDYSCRNPLNEPAIGAKLP